MTMVTLREIQNEGWLAKTNFHTTYCNKIHYAHSVLRGGSRNRVWNTPTPPPQSAKIMTCGTCLAVVGVQQQWTSSGGIITNSTAINRPQGLVIGTMRFISCTTKWNEHPPHINAWLPKYNHRTRPGPNYIAARKAAFRFNTLNIRPNCTQKLSFSLNN